MISIFEISAAQREAGKELAHIACINKIEELEQELETLKAGNEELKGQPHMKKVYDLEQENNHLRLNLKEAYSVDRARDSKIERQEAQISQLKIALTEWQTSVDQNPFSR